MTTRHQLIATVAFLCAMLETADACSREEFIPFSKAARRAETLFVGRVVAWDGESLFVNADEHYPRRITVEVIAVVKGTFGKRRLYMAALGNGVCDANVREFVVGSAWAFIPGALEPSLDALRIAEQSYFRVDAGGGGKLDADRMRMVRNWARGR